MGVSLRLILGLFLILIACGQLTQSATRHTRQTNLSSAENTTIVRNIISDKNNDKIENIELKKLVDRDKITLDTTSIQQDEIKPKTDKEKIVDNNISNSSNSSNENIIKLTLSQPFSSSNRTNSEEKTIDNNIVKQNVTSSEEAKSGRSIDVDINKYVSPDFHNVNNVYRPSISSDTEKYLEPDFDFQASTHSDKKLDSWNGDLTTPKIDFFDNRYKEAVQSVDQTLEHIDYKDSKDDNTSEEVTVEKLLERTKDGKTNTNLDYIKVKNIESNRTGDKNSLHKDLLVEQGTKLDFQSSYNDTKILNDDKSHDDKYNDLSSGGSEIQNSNLEKVQQISTPKSTLTTRKSIVLTKPPSNRNNSHILSNKIETETIKAINEKLESTTTKPVTVSRIENKTTTKLIDVTKRGSVKFSDYSTTTSIPRKSIEQSVQENHIIAVHVSAPENITDSPTTEESTTTDFNISTTELLETTTILESTTYQPEITTILSETTTDFPESSTMEEILTSTMEPDGSTTEIPIIAISDQTESGYRTSKNIAFETQTQEQSTTPMTTTEQITTVNPNENYIEKISPRKETTTPISIVEESTTTKEEFMNTEDINNRTLPPTETTTILYEITNTESVTNRTVEVETTSSINIKNISSPTTEIVIVHIDNIDHTTLLPETIKPSYNYPFPDPIENKTEIEVKKNPETNSTVVKDTFTVIENHTETPTDGGLTDEPGDNKGTIAAIVISSVGGVCLIILVGLLILMRKRQKRFNYGERCTPVGLDDYSLDNISVYNSVSRRKGMLRVSKRSYGNPAFDDPVAVTHPLNFPALAKFATNLEDIKAEYDEVPQITASISELPEGCEVKNRYANVIPLPETRVFLSTIDNYSNSDYINANYVTGPKNTKGYYIACQGPMQNTVDDFWRMIWEQQTKVILMLTHLFENGIEKCIDYLPPSEVLDCHRLFGDFQVTLKKREVKEKYIISSLQLKNMVSNSWREVTHFWYLGWPEKGVPTEANSLIAFLIEARSYMKSSTLDNKTNNAKNIINGATSGGEVNPVVVHCSPGTGRTGVAIACDIAIREFEQTRLVDIPKIVYKIRRDRASAVQTREQYEFIYKVVSLYATKLTGGVLDSL